MKCVLISDAIVVLVSVSARRREVRLQQPVLFYGIITERMLWYKQARV